MDTLRDRLAGIAASAGADLFGVADLSLLEGLPMAPGDDGRALFETYCRAVVLGVRPGKLGPAAGGDAVSAFVQRAAETVRDQLENSGYSCLAIDTEDEVDPIGRFGLISLKAVAKTAGLGWQGRSLLVISPSYGPLHRLAAVLTDAPLPADAPLRNECGECSECVDACPARALSLVEFEDHPDTREDVLNVPRCLGDEGCMLCIQACPYGDRRPKGCAAGP